MALTVPLIASVQNYGKEIVCQVCSEVKVSSVRRTKVITSFCRAIVGALHRFNEQIVALFALSSNFDVINYIIFAFHTKSEHMQTRPWPLPATVIPSLNFHIIFIYYIYLQQCTTHVSARKLL